MRPSKPRGNAQLSSAQHDVFAKRAVDEVFALADRDVHSLGGTHVCATGGRGYATPENRGPLDLVVDATEGFIPLWAKNQHLRWRFDDASFNYFKNAEAAKEEVRRIFAEAVRLWGDSAPILFKMDRDVWDFEISMMPENRCWNGACVLASAFFPDAGRHQLALYPELFQQTAQERIETIIHELGHIFGLRHFFAKIRENQWKSEMFGTHAPFSIMNYGEKSMLTETDLSDLKMLYEQVWSGKLIEINGTRIVQVKPYHQLGNA